MSDIRPHHFPRKLTGHALLLPTDGRDDGGKRWHRYTADDRAWLCECGFAMGNLDLSEKVIRQRFHRPHLRQVFTQRYMAPTDGATTSGATEPARDGISLNDRMAVVETMLDRMGKTNLPWREDMRQQIVEIRRDLAALVAMWS